MMGIDHRLTTPYHPWWFLFSIAVFRVFTGMLICDLLMQTDTNVIIVHREMVWWKDLSRQFGICSSNYWQKGEPGRLPWHLCVCLQKMPGNAAFQSVALEEPFILKCSQTNLCKFATTTMDLGCQLVLLMWHSQKFLCMTVCTQTHQCTQSIRL